MENGSLETWSNLSSGFETTTVNDEGKEVVTEHETIFSVIFDFLGDAASWAGDVSDLIGLL